MTQTATTAQPARKPMTAAALRNRLHAAGIEADHVTRNRRTGAFTIKFVAPNMSNFYSAGTKPARQWQELIQVALPEADILDTYDSIADWRPQQPILFATVWVRLPETKSA